jgi:hypothetical protein
MSPIRNRHARRLFIAAAAGLVAASAMVSSAAFAGGATASGAGFSHGVFSRDAEVHGQWQAVNRHAMRVDDVDSARPFVFQRVAAGSGLTPVSAEVRGGARADQGAQMHGGGSIRADIARYNEERTTPRAPGRQSDDPRSPANSPYRN